MAEGFARALAAGKVDAHSGGSRPSGRVSPLAIDVMREKDVDISHHTSKGFDERWVRDECDLVVTMGCGDDACPAFIGKRLIDWAIPDPAGADIHVFRKVRDEIEVRVRKLLRDELP